jgi:hypothetical protein
MTINPTLRLVSKTKLSESMGVTYQTMYRYHNLAFTFITDFWGDYPIANGNLVTRVNLTDYQAWVIIQIYQRFLGNTHDVIRAYLSDSNWVALNLSKDVYHNFGKSTAQSSSAIVKVA